MSDFRPRDFLKSAAEAAAGFTAAQVGATMAKAGDASFMTNVPDPLLAGRELPTFKFTLERSRGKVVGNSFGKEATSSSDWIGHTRNRSWPKTLTCPRQPLTGSRPKRSTLHVDRGLPW